MGIGIAIGSGARRRSTPTRRELSTLVEATSTWRSVDLVAVARGRSGSVRGTGNGSPPLRSAFAFEFAFVSQGTSRRTRCRTRQSPVHGGAMLEALHLWKFYGGTAAVRDVSFVVGAGEIVGYLGANGSGKSTTARMVTGLLTPSRGVVTFKGRDIAEDLVAYRQRLGYVPEEPALYGYLSGREYLEFVAQLRALPDSVVTEKVPGPAPPVRHRRRGRTGHQRLLQGHEAEGAAHRRAAARSRRPRARRARIRSRRDGGPGHATPGDRAGAPGQGDSLQLARPRQRGAALHARHRPAARRVRGDRHLAGTAHADVTADAGRRVRAAGHATGSGEHGARHRRSRDGASPDMQAQTRLLVRHFVRGYLSTDLAGGERQAALSAALLFSPGLFIIVVLVIQVRDDAISRAWSFSALAGFADRLLIFGGSMVIMALVAVVQWDRLSVDARDASILGVLPLRHGQIVQAKWMATALFAGAAAVLLNGIPSLIYPIVSVGRLEANWLLVLQLTALQLTIGVLSGILGFLVVLTVREGLLALLGARTFARISAAAQASFVVVGLLAFFLQPPFALRALRDGHPSARWWPAVVLAGTFEELGGHRVAALPAAPLPRRVAARAATVLDQYRVALGHAKGSARRTAVAVPGLCLFLASVLFWNNRRRLEAPVLGARGTGARGRLHGTCGAAWHRARRLVPAQLSRGGRCCGVSGTACCLPWAWQQAWPLELSASSRNLGEAPPSRTRTSSCCRCRALVVASVAAGVTSGVAPRSRQQRDLAVRRRLERRPRTVRIRRGARKLVHHRLPVLLLTPLWWSLLGADAAVITRPRRPGAGARARRADRRSRSAPWRSSTMPSRASRRGPCPCSACRRSCWARRFLPARNAGVPSRRSRVLLTPGGGHSVSHDSGAPPRPAHHACRRRAIGGAQSERVTHLTLNA